MDLKSFHYKMRERERDLDLLLWESLIGMMEEKKWRRKRKKINKSERKFNDKFKSILIKYLREPKLYSSYFKN